MDAVPTTRPAEAPIAITVALAVVAVAANAYLFWRYLLRDEDRDRIVAVWTELQQGPAAIIVSPSPAEVTAMLREADAILKSTMEGETTDGD